MNLEELNEEIKKLEDARKELYKTNPLRQEFLKYEWIKGSDMTFDENPYSTYGFHEYILKGIVPDKYKNVMNFYDAPSVSGNSKSYLENITISSDNEYCSNGFRLYTTNNKLFMKFIEEFDLKVKFSESFWKRYEVYSFLMNLKK